MEFFDQKRMWNTLIKINECAIQNIDVEDKGNDLYYSPKAILSVLFYLVRPGSEFSCQYFINSNSLSFTFAATSLYSDKLRALAYAILGRFYKRLEDLTDEKFQERIFSKWFIRIFKNSIKETNLRISHVVSHFFARVCRLASHPEDPLYKPIMSFLSLKPTISLQTVPEFFKLFFSSSTEHHLKERQWILRVCSEAILDTYDYAIFSKIYGVESCMTLFPTLLTDFWTKLLILKIFKRCVEIPKAARDMFWRLNFATWLAQTIQHDRTTVFEQFELSSVYLRIVKQIEHFHADNVLSGSTPLSSNGLISSEPNRLEDQDKGLFLSEPEIEGKTMHDSRTKLNKILIRLSAQKIVTYLTTDKRINKKDDMSKRDLLIQDIQCFVQCS